MVGPFKIIRTAKWRDLRTEVKARIFEPFDDPVFVIYFFLIIVLVGGLGVLLSVIRFAADQSSQNVIAIPRTLSTYSLATVAGAFVQLNFLSFPSGTLDSPLEGARASTMRALWMLALAIVVVVAILALTGLWTVKPAWAYGCSLAGVGCALFLWWIANYDNSNLRLPSPSDVAGGDPDKIEGHIENETVSLK